VAAPAPSSIDPDCVDDLCPDGYRCDLEADVCATRCTSDGTATEYGTPPCQDGYTCSFGDCEPTCIDEDCAHGHLCDPLFNECEDSCFSGEDCRDGFACCTSSRYSDDECDDLSACYRR
jgi:hypothetical protein